jgi:hypothetical protein
MAVSRKRYSEAAGLLLLAFALLFNAFLLAPEARIERVPVNDLPFQIGASQRLGASIAHAEPFLDPWASQWSLGYPLWRIYQPLPHLLAAAIIACCRTFASPASSFAAFYYVLLVLVPASLYLGTRLMGLNPLAAGLASILILTLNEGGDFGRYGLSYGSFVWRGSGLFTELVALLIMLPAFGLVTRAIDSGSRKTGAAVGLALTALSHIFFGYIAFLSTAVWALAGPNEDRRLRVARAASIAARATLLIAWFVIPMLLVGSEVNRSRWDPQYKFDSYGAPVILGELFAGRLLDFGRAVPMLSLMVAFGALIAAFNFNDSLARRLVVLTGVWLVMFFGRETWGHLLLLVGIPSQFHLHRLQGAFELFAVLLAGWGLERAIAAAIRAPGLITIAVGALLGAAILVMALERAEFLRVNILWGEMNLAAFQSDRADLEAALADVRKILAERPGRVSAGKAGDWGGSFKIGFTPVYSVLSSYGFDETSFLYHAISRSSDYMVVRDENDPVQEDFFGIRAVMAPVTLKLPSYFRLRAVHRRFAVYEASPEGYFSLVDIGASYDGPAATWYDPISRWLRSPMIRGGEVVALEPNFNGVPALGRWQPIPDPALQFMSRRGQILTESKVGESYRATIDVQRPCYALIKITYFPGLLARVDGKRMPLIRVFPDFGAIALTPGHHEVEVSYHPGPLKPLLFLAGIMLFILTARPVLSAHWERGERWLEVRIGALGEWLGTERAKTAIALSGLILLFTRALFRGQLLDGHDSLAYPPRLTEFAKIIAEHQFPPLWAPDLSSGHGQPLFEFSPPLPYAVALPFFKCGMRLADSLQLGLATLFAIGAIAVYLIGRKLSFSRVASVGAAAAWLFAPYQALDLFVSVRMAEATALAVTPLALLGLISVLQRPTLINIALSACALAMVPLAHNAIAVLMFPIFAVIVVARTAICDRPWQTGLAGAAALAGAVGLSAFFWLPGLLEKHFVKSGLLLTDFFDWRIHVISLWQLLWGHWGYGYSVAGPHDGISFALGPVHIALAIAGVVIGARALSRTRRLDALIFAGAALCGALLATEWTWFAWQHVAILQYFQFPWRTLAVPALFMPLLTLYALERIGAKSSVVVIVLMVLVNLSHTQPKSYLTFDDEYFDPASIAKTGYETTTRGEYQPRWVQRPLSRTGDGLIIPDSRTSAHALSWTSTRHEYSVTASGPSRVMESSNYYPGWTVLIDGRETAVWPAPGFGEISFAVPAGQHLVTVELRPTRVRRAGSMISFAALLALLLAAIAGYFREWRIRRPRGAGA